MVFLGGLKCLFGCDCEIRHGLVQDYTFDRIELSLPRCLSKCSHCGLETCFPAQANPGWAEVNVFGVILIFESRRQEANNVHLRHASVACQFLHRIGLTHIIAQVADQLADDVPQPMRLLLPSNVARNPARVLDVLLTMQHFPD